MPISTCRNSDQRGVPVRAPECARCAGSTRKHSTSDALSTAIVTSGSTSIICPMTPVSRNSGANAATVVRLAAITGTSMWLEPFSAASSGVIPDSSRVAVSSPTTMASSTMMPSIMISANRLIMLMVWPVRNMIASVADMEIGMPSATQVAMRALRKVNSTSSTTSSPCQPLRTSRLIRSQSMLAWSWVSMICSVGGSVPRMSAR